MNGNTACCVCLADNRLETLMLTRFKNAATEDLMSQIIYD